MRDRYSCADVNTYNWQVAPSRGGVKFKMATPLAVSSAVPVKQGNKRGVVFIVFPVDGRRVQYQ